MGVAYHPRICATRIITKSLMQAVPANVMAGSRGCGRSVRLAQYGASLQYNVVVLRV